MYGGCCEGLADIVKNWRLGCSVLDVVYSGGCSKIAGLGYGWMLRLNENIICRLLRGHASDI